MNYRKIYMQLINKRKTEILDKTDGTENHHVVPKCVGGSDSKNNLVRLKVREHFIAHWLLTKMYSGKERILLEFAFGQMSTFSKTNEYRRANSKLFERSKRAANDAKQLWYSSPYFISPVKGSVWYTDGSKIYRCKSGDLRVESMQLMQCDSPSKGKKWFTNGEDFFMCKPEEALLLGLVEGCPEKGRPKTRLHRDKMSEFRKGMIWFNDGIKNTKLHPTDPRSIGLTPGRLVSPLEREKYQAAWRYVRSQSQNKNNSDRQKGGKFYNDGVKNFVIYVGQEPLPHWHPGRIQRRHPLTQNGPA